MRILYEWKHVMYISWWTVIQMLYALALRSWLDYTFSAVTLWLDVGVIYSSCDLYPPVWKFPGPVLVQGWSIYLRFIKVQSSHERKGNVRITLFGCVWLVLRIHDPFASIIHPSAILHCQTKWHLLPVRLLLGRESIDKVRLWVEFCIYVILGYNTETAKALHGIWKRTT